MKQFSTKAKNCGMTCRVVAAVLLVATSTSLAATAQLRMRLRRVTQEESRGGATTNSLARIEARYMQEYHSAKSQDDKLLICQEMVRLHVNAGMPSPAKVEEYAARGLENAVSFVDRGELLVVMGDARVVTKWRNGTRTASRAECAKPYVEAWRELRAYRSVEKFQELPGVDLFDGPSDTNDPIYKVMAQQHEEQALARKEVKQQNRVLRLRNRALGQIRALYSDADEDALRTDMGSIVESDALVRKILAELESAGGIGVSPENKK